MRRFPVVSQNRNGVERYAGGFTHRLRRGSFQDSPANDQEIKSFGLRNRQNTRCDIGGTETFGNFVTNGWLVQKPSVQSIIGATDHLFFISCGLVRAAGAITETNSLHVVRGHV